MGLNKNLRRYREQAGYTAAKFSDILGLKHGTYASYESGQKTPRLENLVKMADILNVSLDDLVGRTPKNENEKLQKTIKVSLENYPTILFEDFRVGNFEDFSHEIATFKVTFNNGESFDSYITKDTLKCWIEIKQQDISIAFKESFKNFIKERIKEQIFRYCNTKINQYKAEYPEIDFNKADPVQLKNIFPAYVKWLSTINSVYETFDKEDSK